MGSKLKQKIKQEVLKRSRNLASSMGENNALMMASASLRAMGSTSRAALVDIHIPLNNWGKLRKPPDKETLDRLVTIIKPLDDTKTGTMVLGEFGEKGDGTGAAWEYVLAIERAIQGTNNRFTREIQRTIDKAHTKIGTPHHQPQDAAKSKELQEFAKEYINTVVKGGSNETKQ